MKKIIIIVVAVLVLAGGGAGGWWWWSHRAAAEEAAEEGTDGGDEGKKPAEKSKGKKKKAAPEETAAIPLDPFLVNLADKDASRFLRVSLQLVIDNKEFAEALTAKGGHGGEDTHAVVKAKLRSAVLELLTTKTSEHLVTPEGKAELKTEIAEHATEVLEEAEVVDVLFTDFVVQF